MSTLLQEMSEKALKLNIPLSVQLDLTYRCNERCVHCFFDLLEHARRLMFCVKLKTNAVLIREREAARLRDLGVESIQISIYSHRPEVHDAITLIPGSHPANAGAGRESA